MKILAVLFPGFTAIDLVGPVNAWGLMPGVEFQTAWKVVGPVQTDVGLQVVATHSFADCWQAPDVLFVPGGGRGAIEALQDDELLDAIAAIGVRAGWVTSVCTGALLLGAAGLLKGYRSAVTGMRGITSRSSPGSPTRPATSSTATARAGAA